MVRFLIFLMACFHTIDMISQNIIYRNDFTYHEYPIQIEIQSTSNGYLFNVKRDTSIKSFHQYDFENEKVLKSNLILSLKHLFKEASGISIELKDTVSTILLKPRDENDPNSVSVTELQRSILTSYIDSVSNNGDCKELLTNSVFADVLKKTESAELRETMINLINDCLLIKNKTDKIKVDEIDEISNSIIKRLRFLLHIDINAASLALTLNISDTLKYIYKRIEPDGSTVAIESQRLKDSVSAKANLISSFIVDTSEITSSNPEIILKGIKNEIAVRSIQHIFLTDSAQIEFENGTLLNIKVIGKVCQVNPPVTCTAEIFENNFPFPFSTKRAINFLTYDKPLKSKRVIRYLLHSTRNKKFMIDIRRLLHSNYNLLPRTENYSPKDQIVYIKPSLKGSKIYKETTKEILEAKIYTDLVGLNDMDPNGIVQLEFSKKILLFTKVLATNRKFSGRQYHQFFNSFTPAFTINKIEDDDNLLNAQNREIDSSNFQFITFNDAYAFRRSSLGGNLNLYNFCKFKLISEKFHI